jgi:hypothetical protein
MAGPIVTPHIFQVEVKEAFSWGYRAGASPVGIQYRNAAEEAYIEPFEGFTTDIVGRKHTRFKNTNPPESWERLRSYVSFYTSGFKDLGYAQTATLRLYVQDMRGIVSDTNDNFVDYATNWQLEVWTVSGGHNALHRAYFPEEPYPGIYYGFGDTLARLDRSFDYRKWGNFHHPLGDSDEVLEEFVASGLYFDLASDFGNNISYDNFGNPLQFRNSWIEIPIPLDKINRIGATHFRLVHYGEKINLAPLDGGGFWQHHEYIIFETAEGGPRSAELRFELVTPSDDTINDLRLCDLSLYRHLQEVLEVDPVFSDVTVTDAFPDNEVFDNSRNVSVEFVSAITNTVEIGDRQTEDNRRFFIDVVCDRRGELLELQEKIQSILQGSMSMRDFHYGFGRVGFRNVRTFEMPSLLGPDRSQFHSVIEVDTVILRSG